MMMLKTKEISLQSVMKMGGHSRPRRSIRTCNDSSAGASIVFFSSGCGEGVLAAVAWTFEAEALRLRLLDGRGDIHEVLLKIRGGIDGDRVRGMIGLLDDHWRHVIDGGDSKFCRFQGEKKVIHQFEKSRQRHDL